MGGGIIHLTALCYISIMFFRLNDPSKTRQAKRQKMVVCIIFSLVAALTKSHVNSPFHVGGYIVIDKIKALQEMIDSSNNIVAFTGAGCSTESGVPDFRSPGGLFNIVGPNIGVCTDTRI